MLLLLLACTPDAPRNTASLADAPAMELRRREIYDSLRAFVTDLSASERYDCCVKSPCSHCALMTGGCRCGEGLRRGDPVCEECAYLWTRGQGAEPDVDPATVRSFHEAERVMTGAVCACPEHGDGRDDARP